MRRNKSIVLLIFIVFLFIMYFCNLYAVQPGEDLADGNAILVKVDHNYTADNKIFVGKMIIHGRRGSRTISSKSWIKGQESSFTEYLAPAREKGTKMLKLEDQLWIYTPSSDRTIRISGHMLRQSVMGSDLSYEDMMEDPKLANVYNAYITGKEQYDNKSCLVLELKAKQEDVAYHSRKIWVDEQRYIILKEERFAKSGKLLKSAHAYEVIRIENRWFPKKIVFKDELKQGKGTEMIMDSIEFNATIPDYIFSKASLRK